MAYVVSLTDAAKAGILNVGGKAIGIGRLIEAGARVPPGFCIRSSALTDFFESQCVDSLDELAASAACVTAPFPPGLEEEVAQALSDLISLRCPDSSGNHDNTVMVRSSASTEDIVASRAPGVYKSLRVSSEPASVLRAVRTVWASSANESSRRYQQHTNSGDGVVRMAVIVQLFVPGDLGGAISTIDPRTNDPKKIIVSWVNGNPAELMSGLDSGSTVLLDKPYSQHGMVVLPEPIESLPTEVLRLEKFFNEPLDIEFAVDRRSVTYLVQCRPMPYLANWRRVSSLTVEPARSAELHSPKVEAVRLNVDNATDPCNFIIIWPSVFEAYRAVGDLPPKVKNHLEQALAPLVNWGLVSLRPAYWSALNSPDNMPQSGRLRSIKECLDHLESLFRYVIDNGLDDYSAEVAVLAGNWLPVVASAIAAAESGTRVHIDAVAGYPEALATETYESHIVETLTGEVVDGAQPHETPALSVEECRQAAAVTYSLSQQLGSPVRVEILVVERDGVRSIVVWQVDRLSTQPGVATFAVVAAGMGDDDESALTGRAVKIESAKDMLIASARENIDAILLLDISGMRTRDRDAHILIAQQAANLGRPVVLQGSPLSHLAALLREYGVAVYPVRRIDQRICTGDVVTVVPELIW